MTTAALRRARAFAPAHVTGAFAPSREARDPRARGSIGAGLVLELGVLADATWRPASRRRLRVASDVGGSLPISEEVARRLLAGRTGELDVHLRHEVPVGSGLGTSAAGALSVALAVGELLDVPRQHAIETAHLADLFGGGGLGGVSAILGGGLEVRVRPGIPPFGRVVHRRFPPPVFVGVTGEALPSAPLLRDRSTLSRICSAARDLPKFVSAPTPSGFWELSERFTDRAGLAPRDLEVVIRGLRRRGARAAQAMFGRTFFASFPTSRRQEIARWLIARGVRGVEVRAAARGAGGRLVPSASASRRAAATLFPEAPSRRRP